LGSNNSRLPIPRCDQTHLSVRSLHRSASDLTVALELLCIDAEVEWQSIYAGNIPDESIIERWARLKKLQLQAEQRHFPDGFNPPKTMIDMANRQANAYLLSVFGKD
jgi:hypothetical protein